MTIRSFRHIIETFHRHEVDFVVVGGVAAVLHGAPVTTFDLDALIGVSEHNARCLLAAFAELDARYRGHSTLIRPVLPGLLAGGHMLLATNAGPLDVLGFIGPHERLDDLRHAIEHMDIDGLAVPVLSLDELIRQKKALHRDKDEAALRLLEEVVRRRPRDTQGQGPRGLCAERPLGGDPVRICGAANRR